MTYTPRTLSSVLRSAWRRPKLHLVRIPHDSVKIYDQTPPVWARWALVLVSIDVMVATSAVDVIWNTWTMPDPRLQGSNPAEKNIHTPEAEKSSKFQIIPPGHVLVPAWKRALSGSLFVIAGVVVAGSILAARSRIVRTLSYSRASRESPPSVYIQTASHPMKFGNVHAVKDCSLLPSSADQMMVEIKDHGKWILDMRGAKISGRPAPGDKTSARSLMLKTWKAMNGSTP